MELETITSQAGWTIWENKAIRPPDSRFPSKVTVRDDDGWMWLEYGPKLTFLCQRWNNQWTFTVDLHYAPDGYEHLRLGLWARRLEKVVPLVATKCIGKENYVIKIGEFMTGQIYPKLSLPKV